MAEQRIVAGQEVSLGTYPSEWLTVHRAEGKRLCLRRSFGEPAVYSAGFWIDAELISEARWPNRPPRS